MSQAHEYRRDGFILVKGAFHPSWRSAAIEDLCRRWAGMPKEEYLKEARLFPRGMAHIALFLSEGVQRAVFSLGMIKDPVWLTSPAAHVMGVDESWEGVSAHQDWPALQTGLNTVVVWMPLTEVGEENYPVEFAKGSHLSGLLPAKAGAHYSEVDDQGLKFTAVPCSPGDIILFSAFTVHRTRTPGKGYRLGLSMRFEDGADEFFKATGNYSAQKRVIEREVKFVPTDAQVRAVFGQ